MGLRELAHRFRTIPARNNTRAGYGHTHRLARAAAARQHQPTDPCTVCAQPLGPIGPWLHYDHNGQRTGYLGFAHARCNIVKGAREGRRRQNPQRIPRGQSRAW